MAFSYTCSSQGWNGQHGYVRMGATTDTSEINTLAAHMVYVRRCHQVHGLTILDDASEPNPTQDSDGLITHMTQTLLLVQTADCVPVHLVTRDSVGLVHAGWRGIQSGIIRKICQLMNPDQLFVVLGPAICQKHYPVGPDVFQPWMDKDPTLSLSLKKHPEQPNRMMLDLKHHIFNQFQSDGVKPSNIISIPLCTYESQTLPSFRRDGKNTKRLLSYIFKAEPTSALP